MRVYTGGVLISRHTQYLNCISQNNGGAIYNSGYANLTNVQFDTCTALNGNGGAVYNTHGADMISSDMRVSSCISSYGGGGFSNNGTANLELISAAFLSNNATVTGGDISVTGVGSTISITDSIFSQSHAGVSGGSIDTSGTLSELSVSNTLFSLTYAEAQGGVLAALEDAIIDFKG